jgi:hypothetical protein
MKTRILILATLLGAAGAGVAFAANPAGPAPESRVTVVFVAPEKFTDVKYDWTGNSPDLLDQIHKFMCETGARYVPEGMRLEIKITDISLAGEFEPWRGPSFDHVRIVRSIYPPRFNLEFRLVDAKGNVVSEGKREIKDLAFQMRIALPSNDYLRYEKDMLRDWFRTEFRAHGKT